MKITREINARELQRRVQIACLLRNTSIAQLAEGFGIQRQSLYYTIHTGRIGIKGLSKIAMARDVSVDWLLGDIPLEISFIKGTRAIKLSDV